jgi:hypothetical protein
MPFLKSLFVIGFSSVDPTGLNELSSLSLHDIGHVHGFKSVRNVTMLDINSTEIDPAEILALKHLKKFVFSPSDGDLEGFPFLDYWKNTVTELVLNAPEADMESILVPASIKTLHLSLPVETIHSVNPNQFFSDLNLSGFAGKDISLFGNVERIVLLDCKNLENIQPIALVPYLTIHRCPNIRSFDCLGSQKYLDIGQSDSLNDSDMERFGNISYLSLNRCNHITKATHLWNNRFVTISCCSSLSETCFLGSDFHSCEKIRSIKITGKIYCLRVVGPHSLKLGRNTTITGLKNCRHAKVPEEFY